MSLSSGTLRLIFTTGIIENYLAGAFISAKIAYAGKTNKTQDQTPAIFEELAEPKILQTKKQYRDVSGRKKAGYNNVTEMQMSKM